MRGFLSRATGWWPGLQSAVVLTVVLLVTSAGVAWAFRRRAASGRESTREGVTPDQRRFSAAVALLSFGLLVVMAARFRFSFDDFFYLERAAASPFEPDDSLRLALAGLFELGVELGSPTWLFVLANALATLALLALAWGCWARLGLCRWTASLAASLIAVAPGLFELSRWGAGFQQLASMALVLGVLYVASGFAEACSGRDWRRAVALASLGAALGATGVFVKYPTMTMVPIAAVVWSAVVARPRSSWRQAAGLGAALAFGVAVPFLLAHLPERDGELEKVGTASIAHNVLAVVRRLKLPLAQALLAMAAMWLAGRYRDGARTEAALAGLDWRQGLGLIAVAAVLGVPYLFNARYFARYYAILPFVALTPLLAMGLLRYARNAPRWSLGLAILLLIPFKEIRAHTEASVFNDVGRRMEEVAAASRSVPPSTRIALVVRCDNASLVQRSAEEVEELLRATEGNAGFRWATGWRDAQVERFADASDPAAFAGAGLRLFYCHGRPLVSD